MIIGNALFREDEDFVCIDDSCVLVTNNSGAGFSLVYSVLILSYSIMLLVVFYHFPSKYGLIAKRRDLLNTDPINV